MSNGRHFNPPTPAYRPRDPFSNITPRLAEFVPSCETTKPPPSRPRQVRMDSSSAGSSSTVIRRAELPQRAVVPAAPVIPAERPLPGVKSAAPVPASAKEAQPAAAPARALPPRPALLVPEVREIQALSRNLKEEGKKKRPMAKEEPAPVPAKASPPTRAPVAKASRAPVKEAPPLKASKAAKVGKARNEGPVAGEGEEIRVCEWEKCGKKFAVHSAGRTVVRRFCSGTCRGRASEARHGKR